MTGRPIGLLNKTQRRTRFCQVRSTQRLLDVDSQIRGSRVERCFPYRNLAVPHLPNFDAETPHAPACVGVVPLAVPEVRDNVIHQRAEILFEAIALLPDASRREELPERVVSPEPRDYTKSDDAVFGETRDQSFNVVASDPSQD